MPAICEKTASRTARSDVLVGFDTNVVQSIETTDCETGAEQSGDTAFPACGACGFERLIPCGFKRTWRLWRCGACGSVRVWPQPAADELAALYSKKSGYFVTAATRLATTSPMGARNIHRRLISAGTPGVRVLDVGCGTGQLIYHLREHGWHVRGIDLNADAIAVARANGLDAIACDLASGGWPAASFDVIHMGDLIEHVPDPCRTIQHAFRLLSRKGLLLIRTPNAACGFATSTSSVLGRLGVPWPHSEAPYHLHEFSSAGLAALVRRAGFEIVSLQCEGRTPFWYTLGGLGWFDDLKVRLKRGGRYQLDWRLMAAAPGLAAAASMLFPFHLYGLVADRLRCTGRTVTVLARRSAVSCRDDASGGDCT